MAGIFAIFATIAGLLCHVYINGPPGKRCDVNSVHRHTLLHHILFTVLHTLVGKEADITINHGERRPKTTKDSPSLVHHLPTKTNT